MNFWTFGKNKLKYSFYLLALFGAPWTLLPPQHVLYTSPGTNLSDRVKKQLYARRIVWHFLHSYYTILSMALSQLQLWASWSLIRQLCFKFSTATSVGVGPSSCTVYAATIPRRLAALLPQWTTTTSLQKLCVCGCTKPFITYHAVCCSYTPKGLNKNLQRLSNNWLIYIFFLHHSGIPMHAK